MKRWLKGLCLGFGIFAFHCSTQTQSSADLGSPQDDGSASSDDLATPTDLAVPSVNLATLSVLAGGRGGPGNLDGTRALARFSGPSGVASDGSGNFYVVDTQSHTIRKVVASTGVVTTFAGAAGQPGSANGVGTSARFSSPRGIVSDGLGNLLVADTGNHTIRKIVLADGAVSTLAGIAGTAGFLDGVSASARFSSPYGLAVDASKNVYVADSGNHRIRRIDVTGLVSVFAGSGSRGLLNGASTNAQFNTPVAVGTDGASNFYVADSGNHMIRRITSGNVTTFAGSGILGGKDGTGSAAAFSNPSGLAFDGAGNLLVGDTGNHAVRQIVLSSAVVTTLTGLLGASGSADGMGNVARFSNPLGLTSDGAGNLVVADSGNDAIRIVVQSSAAVTTLAGAASQRGSTDGSATTSRFHTPCGVTQDAAGNLYVADRGNHTVRQFVKSSGSVITLAGAVGNPGSADGTGVLARFNEPCGIAYDGSGNLLIADSGNHTLRKLVVGSGVVTTLAGAAGMSGVADGASAAARFKSPYGLALDGQGNLYVADRDNHTIRQLNLATGMVTTLAGMAGTPGSADGNGTTASFNTPYGVVSDNQGRLFVADTGNHTVRQVVMASRAVSTPAGLAGNPGSTNGIAGMARFNRPMGIAWDGAGSLWICDSANGTLRRLLPGSGTVSTVVGVAGQLGIRLGPLPASLNQPVGVSASPAGVLYLIDQTENVILRAD